MGLRNLPPSSGTLSSYTPTLRERMTDQLRQWMFTDDRAGQQQAEKVMGVADMTPVGMATGMYDAGREAAGGNYLPAGASLAMAMIPGPDPKVKGIRAYHGSPHDFDRFDMSKIGTGEGAQAYGHGLYFAESEGVAKSYKDALSGQTDPSAVGYIFKAGGDKDAAIKAMEADLAGRAPPKHVAAMRKEIEEYGNPRGRMYEVSINASPDDFLDWDRPLSDQPEAVRNLLPEMKPEWTGGQIHESSKLVPGDFFDKKAAQEALKARGIPGIKYLDAGSRTKGDGSRNYVVFDDKLVEIVRKYGIAGVSAMAGYNILDGMDEAQAAQLRDVDVKARMSQALMGGSQ